MRWLTAGESHGQGLVAILEGFPAGVPITAEAIDLDLSRRQTGYGRGGRMSIETDRVQILAGIRHGESLGGPISLLIHNRDWDNWREEMNPAPGPDSLRKVTRPRPGHADLPGVLKYARHDARDILERASARETAARVALGALAKALLAPFGIQVRGMVRQIGGAFIPPDIQFSIADAEASPVRCPHQPTQRLIIEAIDQAKAAGDTLGGIFEIQVTACPPGLGSHVQADRRLDGRLAAALMSIPGVKAVEIGLGFGVAGIPGSQVHDEIAYEAGRGFFHPTNRAGGIEGGISNGESLVLRGAMKPIPTLMKPLPSVDLLTKVPAQASVERSDVCAVPAASVVGEGVVALEVARVLLEKFGGDSLGETKRNYDAYLRSIENF